MLNIITDQVRIFLDLPDDLIDERFFDFVESNEEKTDDIRGTIHVRTAGTEELKAKSSEEPQIYETDFATTEIYSDRIVCFFKEDSGWQGLVVSDENVLCVPDEDMKPGPDSAAAIFDYMKGGIFLILRKFGYYVLHCSSLIVNGRVVAFTAESGVGKTTHTRFWEDLYRVPLFNGDMIMIDASSQIPHAIGIPWSGSTYITTKGRLPIGGIFFLERGAVNEVREVTELEKLILLTQRMLSVNFDHREFLKNAETLRETASHIKCARLICLPDEEAAETAHEYADRNNWF